MCMPEASFTDLFTCAPRLPAPAGVPVTCTHTLDPQMYPPAARPMTVVTMDAQRAATTVDVTVMYRQPLPPADEPPRAVKEIVS